VDEISLEKPFKTSFETELYFKYNCLSRARTNALAKLRCGVVPLAVELKPAEMRVFL